MSSYSEGQTHQLMDAFEAAGFTTVELTRLGQNRGWLRKLKELTNGCAEIALVTHEIDCDADPSFPEGGEGGIVEKHQCMGKVSWDFRKISLHLEYEQKKEVGCIGGHALREKLESQPVLNACVLDYLLEHTYLIPEEWKGKTVFFWGTIYRHRNGDLYVRCLFQDFGKWKGAFQWLRTHHFSYRPAVVLAA